MIFAHSGSVRFSHTPLFDYRTEVCAIFAHSPQGRESGFHARSSIVFFQIRRRFSRSLSCGSLPILIRSNGLVGKTIYADVCVPIPAMWIIHPPASSSSRTEYNAGRVDRCMAAMMSEVLTSIQGGNSHSPESVRRRSLFARMIRYISMACAFGERG